MKNQNRFRGCLLGLAVGDAIGTTSEFQQPGTFTPVTDMVGGGVFKLKRGQWTDDTSMALCMATSLADLRRFDAQDVMQRFCKWRKEGYLSSNGTCFDIGIATTEALSGFEQTGNPFSGSTNPRSAGNGGIMRLAPIPMFCYPDLEAAIQISVDSSRLTHAADECLDASRLLAAILHQALSGSDKQAIVTGHGISDLSSESIRKIAQGDYLKKELHEIRNTGYVVDSLEAALWCFATTESFEEAILRAANLGGDADTIAAICGQIAGAHYGESGIPQQWLEHLAMVERIRYLADWFVWHVNEVSDTPVDMDMESIQRVNQYLENKEFVIAFRHDEDKWVQLLTMMNKFDMRWNYSMILIRYEPNRTANSRTNGAIFVKDGRKRSVTSMNVEALGAKAFSYGHNFDAATTPDIYRELTGLEMTKVEFRKPHTLTFSRRGEDRKEREF